MTSFFNSPEEFLEAMKKRVDSQQMQYEADEMAIQSLLEDIGGEHLAGLQKLLGIITQSPEVGVYFMGLVSGILKYKYDRCPHCGDPGHDSFIHASPDKKGDNESPKS